MSCNLRKAGYSLPALISFLSLLQGNLSFSSFKSARPPSIRMPVFVNLNNPDRLCRLGILIARKQKASPNGACLEGSPD